MYINIKICVIYESDRWTHNPLSVFELDDCLWGVVKLTKNTDNDKYGYRGYVFDFIHVQLFHYHLMELVKILFLFVQITLHQHRLIYQSLEKV